MGDQKEPEGSGILNLPPNPPKSSGGILGNAPKPPGPKGILGDLEKTPASDPDDAP
jgi:hypothetical protein